MAADPEELREILESEALAEAVDAVRSGITRRAMAATTPDEHANDLRREIHALERVMNQLRMMASQEAPDND